MTEIERTIDLFDELYHDDKISSPIYFENLDNLERQFSEQFETIENILDLWFGDKPATDYQCTAKDYRTGEWWGFNEVVATQDGVKAITPEKLTEEQEGVLTEDERSLLEELHAEGFSTVVTEDGKRYVFNDVTAEVRRVPLLDLIDIKQTRANSFNHF